MLTMPRFQFILIIRIAFTIATIKLPNRDEYFIRSADHRLCYCEGKTGRMVDGGCEHTERQGRTNDVKWIENLD